MKKDCRSILYGFTMAEILISITIAMIVATAMVPIFGTKKVKHPTNKIVHGIAVCYYDNSGQLRYEVKENRSDGAGNTGSIEGDHCTFQLPKANYIEITAIGAGGASTYNETSSISGLAGANYAGSLRIDGYYQYDIDSAALQDELLPRKIRTTLNEWANTSPDDLYAEFTDITSPIGQGGSGRCRAEYSNVACNADEPARGGDAPNNSFYTAHVSHDSNDTENDCWWFQHGKGTDSGYGLKKSSLKLPLNGHSVLQVEKNITRTKIAINRGGGEESIIILSSSGSGLSPLYDSDNKQYKTPLENGSNATCLGAFCSDLDNVDPHRGAAGGIEQVYSRSCIDSFVPATEGSVTYLGQDATGNSTNQGAINWSYIRPIINATFAEGGAYGSEITQAFDNLRGSIELYPASSNASRSFVRKDNKIIVSASSGADNGATIRYNVKVNETYPSDIKEAAVPDNLNHFRYLDKIKGSGFRLPIANCGNNGGICPGFGGRGKYLLFKSTEGLETLTLTNRQNNKTYTKDFGGDLNYRGSECLNNDTKSELSLNGNKDVVSECTGANRNGGRGAIVLIW